MIINKGFINIGSLIAGSLTILGVLLPDWKLKISSFGIGESVYWYIPILILGLSSLLLILSVFKGRMS